MSIGTGIVLMVIGAILTFAVNVESSVIDLDLVGYIFLAAGIVTFVIGLALLLRRRQSVTTTRAGADPVSGERVERRVTEVDDPAV